MCGNFTITSEVPHLLNSKCLCFCIRCDIELIARVRTNVMGGSSANFKLSGLVWTINARYPFCSTGGLLRVEVIGQVDPLIKSTLETSGCFFLRPWVRSSRKKKGMSVITRDSEV